MTTALINRLPLAACLLWLAASLFPLSAPAADNIIGHLGTGTWSCVSSSNNCVLVWSATDTLTYWSDPYSNSLLVCYKFDTFPTNGVGLIDDTSPLGTHDGTNQPNYATGPTWTNNSGQGWYEFDEADDWIGLPNVTGFWNAGSYTVAAWIRGRDIVSTSGGQAIFGVSDTAGNHVAMLGAIWNSPVAGVWNLGMQTYESVYAYTMMTGSAATVYGTNWHHIAATKSGTTCVLYWDGVPVVTSTTKTVSGLTDSRVGNRRDGVKLWEGGLDDLRVYTNALSASDISGIYTNTGGLAPNSHGSRIWEQ